MNLLASFDWLSQYVDLGSLTPEAFAARVSLSGPGVERLYPQGVGMDGIVVGHVLEVKPHPQADKLRLAVVDVGSAKLSIVCGGSNLSDDQWVVVAKVGSKVKWHGEGDLVELKPTEIRGVSSDGMICAANEVGLFDAFPHAEREILDLGAAFPDAKFVAGLSLADFLGLSTDTVMDIEITTNRPDAMGMIGLAREASAILGQPFTWEPAPSVRPARGSVIFPVTVVEPELCPRYQAIRLDGVVVAPSPWWLKRRLLSAGIRPINNLVDITNFVLLELGQPMHVFDAQKLDGGSLTVRKARSGEEMAALDGKTYKLDDSMLVIADASRPVAVAGVMGGEETSVTTDTTSVVFEAATFNPVSVRRTARKLNLYSDSQLRFEKGLSTEALPDALARAVELCLELAGGDVTSRPTDLRTGTYKPVSHAITFAEMTKLIGVELPSKEIVASLKRLGFGVKATKTTLTATVPWWRDHDIESGRDLVEEVARLYGYVNLPAVFPVGLSGRSIDPELVWEDRVRQTVKGAGWTEAFTYSFVSKDLMEKAGYDASKVLHVQNPLNQDFEYMRTSLLPSLLQVVVENQERESSQKLFEIAHVYYPKAADWKDLPDEQLEFGGAVVGGEEPWREAKGLVEHLFRELGLSDVTWKRLEGDLFWHSGRTVQAWVGSDLVGTIGEIHPTIGQKFGIAGRVAVIDLPLERVFVHATTAKKYEPLPIFPEAKRDIALVVTQKLEVQAALDAMRAVTPLLTRVTWFDTYQGKGLPEGKKSLAFHLEFSAKERTLETAEVEAAMKAVGERVGREFGAEVRG